MNYNIYMDESGNTGNIELHGDLTWNYGNQTHFALGAFYIREDIANILEEILKNILHKYDKKLGTEQELKSKANYVYKNKLFEEITDVLIKNKIGFYFDIANKKYKVVMTLVSYCIYPYYINDFTRTQCIDMANFLFDRLPLEEIYVFIVMCQSQHDSKKCVNELIDFLKRLNVFLISNKKNSIDRVIDIVENYNSYRLKVENLFPIKDFNNKGTKESFLPNVDAFNNLLASIYKLRLKQDDNINIYHDEQRQFSNVLEKWVNNLHDFDINIRKINFVDSKQEILIQIADFYTGNIVRLYRKIVEYKCLNRDDRELIKILKPLLENCNIVSSKSEQKEFFDKCGMKMMKSPIPL